jgi:hypothetical protein
MNTKQSSGNAVQLDKGVYKKLVKYAEVTGLPLSVAVNQALKDWMETVGDVRITVIENRRTNNLIV